MCCFKYIIFVNRRWLEPPHPYFVGIDVPMGDLLLVVSLDQIHTNHCTAHHSLHLHHLCKRQQTNRGRRIRGVGAGRRVPCGPGGPGRWALRALVTFDASVVSFAWGLFARVAFGEFIIDDRLRLAAAAALLPRLAT